MRKLVLVFLLFSCFFSFAQNPALLEKRWFAQYISIDGTQQEIPTNDYIFPFAYVDFYSGSLIGSSNSEIKGDCYSGFSGHVNYSDVMSFNFVDLTPFYNNGGCNDDDLAMLDFMSLYKSFYINEESNTFTYYITDVYGIANLQIINNNGDHVWFSENPFQINFNSTITESPWSLEKIVLNDVEVSVPDLSSEEFEEITLRIVDYYTENINGYVSSINSMFTTSGCSLSTSMINLDSQNKEFFLYEIGGSLSDCGNSTVSSFYNDYASIFTNSLPGVFSYDFITEDGLEKLIITNTVGNQAVYSRSVLAIDDVSELTVAIYPNPTEGSFHIDLIENKVNLVKIYNVLGEIVVESKVNVINLSKFENGLYMLHIKLNNGNTIIKKVIKK